MLAREKRKYEEAEGIYLLLLHIRRGVCEEALPLSEIYASFENQALEETPFLSLLRKEGLAEALKKLNERELGIIRRRYYAGKTQMEIADEIGISQAQVSRLEKGAIDKLRKYME